jgi:hypothetical protein
MQTWAFEAFLVRKFSVREESLCRGAGMLGQRPERAVTPVQPYSHLGAATGVHAARGDQRLLH